MDVTDSVTVVYDQFIDAIEGKANLTITAQQAMRVMKVMEAAFLPYETGNAISVRI